MWYCWQYSSYILFFYIFLYFYIFVILSYIFIKCVMGTVSELWRNLFRDTFFIYLFIIIVKYQSLQSQSWEELELFLYNKVILLFSLDSSTVWVKGSILGFFIEKICQRKEQLNRLRGLHRLLRNFSQNFNLLKLEQSQIW